MNFKMEPEMYFFIFTFYQTRLAEYVFGFSVNVLVFVYHFSGDVWCLLLVFVYLFSLFIGYTFLLVY